MSAKHTTHSNENGKGLPDWEKERIKVNAEVSEMILDPIMLFAELLRGYNEKDRMQFNPAEIGAVIRLLALGGLVQTLTHGNCDFIDREVLESMLDDFADAVSRHKDGAE